MGVFNNTTCEEIKLVEHDGTTKWVVLVFGVVLVVCTVFLNSVVIAKVNRKIKLNIFTKHFLTSLASVDLCVGLTLMPFNIINELFYFRLTLGRLFCDFVNSLDYALCTASVFFLTILTFDRYLALSMPFKYHRMCNKKTAVITSLSSWILLTLISFGTIPTGYVYYGMSGELLDCVSRQIKSCVFLMSKYFAVVSSTTSILLPAVIIIYLNVKLSKHLNRQRSVRMQLASDSATASFISQRHMSQSIHVAKTIAVLTGGFLICWMPFFVTVNINVFTNYSVPNSIYMTALWLGYINSTLNPFLYILLERKSCIGRH